jgi:hypothetical protein
MKSETHFVDHVSLRLKAQKMLQPLRVKFTLSMMINTEGTEGTEDASAVESETHFVYL